LQVATAGVVVTVPVDFVLQLREVLLIKLYTELVRGSPYEDCLFI
jgi:hypothetical protein